MDTIDTCRALKVWFGDHPVKNIQRIYSDNHESFIKAAQELPINHELSTPGVHNTNADWWRSDVQ